MGLPQSHMVDHVWIVKYVMVILLLGHIGMTNMPKNGGDRPVPTALFYRSMLLVFVNFEGIHIPAALVIYFCTKL